MILVRSSYRKALIAESLLIDVDGYKKSSFRGLESGALVCLLKHLFCEKQTSTQLNCYVDYGYAFRDTMFSICAREVFPQQSIRSSQC